MKTLRDLGPGDEVAVCPHFGAPYIRRIVRVTAKAIFVRESSAYESKWNRETGYPVPRGRDFTPTTIRPVDDVIREQADRERLVYQIDRVTRDHDRIRHLSTDTLRAIAAALRADPATGGERG